MRKPERISKPSPASGQANRPGRYNGKVRPAPVSASPKTGGPKPAAASVDSSFSRRTILFFFFVTVAFLMIFPSLRTWMVQQEEYRDLKLQLSQAQTTNKDLDAQLKRWDDPEYVAGQARARLGYVRPGETTYVVVDPPPEPAGHSTAEASQVPSAPPPWFMVLNSSLETTAKSHPEQ